MKVFIDKDVHASIEEFYDIALSIHRALDEQTVINKVNRLYEAMEALGHYARLYPLARLKNGLKKNIESLFVKIFILRIRFIHCLMDKR